MMDERGDLVRDSALIPVIDFSRFDSGSGRAGDVAAEMGRACREFGFFYVVGHGVDEGLAQRLEQLSRQFFSQDLQTKLAIRMELGGRAWRGYFPVGAELTLGQPDQKEGLYFGAELGDDHPKVAAGTYLHGPNLFPELSGFRETVLEYLDAMTRLGHRLMAAFAVSLGLDASYFNERYTYDPLILFRIFHYPPLPADDPASQRQAMGSAVSNSQAAGSRRWSVGEHTDYGILTILRQDNAGGLEVKSQSRWIEAPPLPGSLVCNIGDMLDRMTGGLYRSTPHRVRNVSGKSRLSFPFFFDPNFDAEVKLIDPNIAVTDDKSQRWDRSSVHQLSGTYGDYILQKVAKVFPELHRDTRML
jgi:isopenicillin N synthase-like dioxygenase